LRLQQLLPPPHMPEQGKSVREPPRYQCHNIACDQCHNNACDQCHNNTCDQCHNKACNTWKSQLRILLRTCLTVSIRAKLLHTRTHTFTCATSSSHVSVIVNHVTDVSLPYFNTVLRF
jgi:hypothetical protein